MSSAYADLNEKESKDEQPVRSSLPRCSSCV